MSAPRSTSLLADEPRAQRKSLLTDVLELLKLAAPLFLSGASFSVMKTTDSALLGHSGTRYLTAVTLSELWTSTIGVFMTSRCLGTLGGQAFGAKNYALVGIYMQVAFVVLGLVACVVVVGRMFTGVILHAFGKDDDIVHDAQYFVNVMTLCVPFRIVFGQLTTFFSCQKIMRPSAVAAPPAMLLNAVLGLVLVVGFLIPGFAGFGFAACPWVTVVVEVLQLLLVWYVFCVRQRLHEQCWGGWSMAEVTRQRVKTFVKLWLPSAISSSSDFWRVTVLGIIASSTGDINVAVWNTSYRICWLCLIFIGAMASAMGIKLNIALGSGDLSNIRRVIGAAFIAVGITIGILMLLIVCIPRHLGMIFSSDAQVLDLFEESRFGLAAFVGLMNLAMLVERIPTIVGRPDLNLKLGLIGSWLGQVPGAYLCTKYWRSDLVGLYTGSAIGYGLLAVLLSVACLFFDWEQLASDARRRAEVSNEPAAPARELAIQQNGSNRAAQVVQPSDDPETGGKSAGAEPAAAAPSTR